MVYGDDLVAVGKEEDLQDTEKTLKQRYKLKVETLGNEEKDLKEIRVLNKVIRISSAGLELEADPRHAELVVKALGLEGASVSKTPGIKHSSVRGQGGETEVREQESRAGGKRRVERHDAAERTVLVDVAPMRHGQYGGTISGAPEEVSRRRAPPVDDLEEVSRRRAPPEDDVDVSVCEGLVVVEAGVSVIDPWKEEGEGEEMTADDARSFRAVVARLNYMAGDRPDMQYAVKEMARSMSSPKTSDWQGVIRIGKYLKGCPRLVLKYPWQRRVKTIVAYTDSDWAGCTKTAKSTSGGLIMIGEHLVKSYSRQQKTIALSSAEAELHAMVAASAEALGIIALCRDMGMIVEGEVYADSSAALGITQRSGQGKTRHIKVQALWVQEVRCNKRLGYKKVLGTRNPADVLTKHVPGELLRAHLQAIGVEYRGGRAETAPTLDSVEAFTQEWVVDTREAGSERTTDVTDGRESKELVVSKVKVRFSSKVHYRAVPSLGKGLPTKRAGKTRRDSPWTGASASVEQHATAPTSVAKSDQSPVLSFSRPAGPRNEGGALILRAPQATTDVYMSPQLFRSAKRRAPQKTKR